MAGRCKTSATSKHCNPKPEFLVLRIVFLTEQVKFLFLSLLFLTEEGKQGNGRGNRRGGRGKEGDSPENLIGVLKKANKKRCFLLECTFGRSLVMIQEPDSNTTRLEICHNRRDRRLCKIFSSCINFSRKQCVLCIICVEI